MSSRRKFIKTAAAAGIAVAATGYSTTTAKAGSSTGDDSGKTAGAYAGSVT